MKTNEQYLAEIDEMLTDFANNKHGAYKTSVPEKDIKEVFSLVYCIVKEVCGKYREQYADESVFCPEWEKEYLEETE